MRYSIEKEDKILHLPNGDSIRGGATECEILLWAENQSLRAALLNKRGDDLCWVEDPARARALPEAEFMESCRRHRAQIAKERGELSIGQMTIAQLEKRVVELEEERDGHLDQD